MRALSQKRRGGSDVLGLVDRPEPDLGPNVAADLAELMHSGALTPVIEQVPHSGTPSTRFESWWAATPAASL